MYPDDEKLVAQTLSGDRDAFGVLVHKYQEMVYTYVFQKVRNEADAQDVTQEVFLRAYRNLYQLRHPHQFRSWLYTIMSNECNRWLVRVTKTRQRETGLEDATEEAVRIDPKYTTPTEEWQVDLEQAISRLPNDSRVAVSMFYMSNCSLKEISEFLGISVNTVKIKLHRARQQLGSALSDRYGKFLKDHKLKGGFLMQVMKQIITETNLTNLNPFHRGKVRDLYAYDDQLIIISTDRISAFDSVLPNGIPHKGRVLTGLSEFWFNHTHSVVENHLITTDIAGYPDTVQPDAQLLKGRSMLVRRTNRIDVECVVRGYIAGSAWAEYQASGTVCGEPLPQGLRESERLPQPIFTPATKAEHGEHDENISIAQMEETIGKVLTDRIIQTSFNLFESATAHAEKVGLILCDTKFEFGLIDDELILIDEVFTPDSSRFWPKDEYEPGRPQSSFDKQYVRDYLLQIGWDKDPPAPELPDEVIHRTSEKYLEAYRLIIGHELQK